MRFILKSLTTACLLLLLATALFGIAYPLIVKGLGFAFFPKEAEGSLVRNNKGIVIGSHLIGQNFSSDIYFHPRPSYAGDEGYDASYSGASYLGPTSKKLIDSIIMRSAHFRQINGIAPKLKLPADAVMSSASGLDPHISLENAKLQMRRVATARGVSAAVINDIVLQHAVKSYLIKDPFVNVLELNLTLDQNVPQKRAHATQ